MITQYPFKDLQAFVASLGVYGRFFLQSFGYPLDFATILTGASGEATLRMSANSDFLLTNIRFNQSVAGPVLGSFLQVVDNGSSENFFQQPVPINAVCDMANAGFANYLQFPRIIGNASSLTATLTNGSGSSFTLPQIYFEGVLIKQLATS